MVLLVLSTSHSQGRADVPKSSTRSQRLALLVGISAYDQSGQQSGLVPWPPLHAEPDLQRLTAALLHLGFAASDIVVLRDQAASRQNIRAAVRTHLIDKATPGSQIVFHFSGHGQQVADDNGDELDGLDETLVPSDARDQRAGAGAQTNIRDDEVGQWLRALQSRMRVAGKLQGSITVSFDSCFAGTMARGIWEERGRGWDPDLDGPRPLPQADAAGRRSALSIAEADGDFVALSAARSNQTAKGSSDGGFFSKALAGALLRATRETTYRGLLDEIADEVEGKTHSQQCPQLEGQAEKLVLGGIAPAGVLYQRVTGYDGQTLTLPIGELHLVSVGSLYAVHRAGNAPLSPATLLAQARVVRVWPLHSELLLVAGGVRTPLAAEELRGARAVELSHRYHDSELRLYKSGLQTLPGLMTQLQALAFLRWTGTTARDHDLELRVTADSLALIRPEAREPVATWPISQVVLAEVIETLHAQWRWQRLHRLTGGNPALRVSLMLVPLATAAALPGQPPRAWPEPVARWGNDLQLPVDSYFTMQLHNASDRDLYVTILELGPSGEIRSIFPSRHRPGDRLIAQHSTVLLPVDPYLYRVTPPYGRSILRVLATSEPVDFTGLVQRAYAERGGGHRAGPEQGSMAPLTDVALHWQPLAQLLYDIAAGERLGSSVDIARLDWGTSLARVEVVPPPSRRPTRGR